jgi:hypothetical protein
MDNSKSAGNGAYVKCEKKSGHGFKMTGPGLLTDTNIHALNELAKRISDAGHDFYRLAFTMPDVDRILPCQHDRYNGTGKLYSLPHVDGIMLHEFFNSGGVTAADRLGVCVQLLAIIDFLNTPQEIYHNDLKPDNIMVVHESSDVFIGQLNTQTNYRVRIIDMEGVTMDIEVEDIKGKCSQYSDPLLCIIRKTSNYLLHEAKVMWSNFTPTHAKTSKSSSNRSAYRNPLSASHPSARSKSSSSLAEPASARSKSPSLFAEPASARSKSPSSLAEPASAPSKSSSSRPVSSHRSKTVNSRTAYSASRSGSAKNNVFDVPTLKSPDFQKGGDRASLDSIRQLAIAHGRRPPGPKTAARAIGVADRMLTAILQSASATAGATTVSWRNISSATERMFPDMDLGVVIALPADAGMQACASNVVTNSGCAITAQSMKRVGSIYAAVVVACLAKA